MLGYCGNTLDVTSTLAAIGDCGFICPGSSSEYCGAGNRLELYKLTSQVSGSSSVISSSSQSTTSSASASPSVQIVKYAGLYNYMGCFTEENGVRALAAASYQVTLTPSKRVSQLALHTCTQVLNMAANVGVRILSVRAPLSPPTAIAQ
jgi:hypothetical protein